MTRKRRSGTPTWFYPKTPKGVNRFAKYLEGRQRDLEHRLEVALIDALSVMGDIEDIEHTIEDADIGSALYDEFGKPRLKSAEVKALEKRIDEVERWSETFGEGSNIGDDVNTLHSFVIGVIDSWNPSGS